MNNKTLLSSLAAAALMMANPSFAQAPYTVTNGDSLDATSYQGYKSYRQWCARCHGVFGEGGPNAPSLANSLTKLTEEEFIHVVKTGEVKEEHKTTSAGIMPSWQRNPHVMRSIDGIYSYLKARADGAIGAVQPNLAK